MIWTYFVKGKEFVATDVFSLKQLLDLSTKNWIWIDIFNPDEKETEIISELLGNEPEFVENIKKHMQKPIDPRIDGNLLCNYKKIHDYVFAMVPSITMIEKLRIYPIAILKKKKMIITWGEEKDHSHSRIIKTTIRRLREGVEEGQDLNSSLVISVLFREIAIKNSNIMLSVREKIEQMEEIAIESGGKKLLRSIFSLKKSITSLYRVMIDEKDFMLDIDKSIIPRIKLDEKSKPIVGEAIEIIDRELDFIDSYDRTLDSILTLFDLASIHKVESSINYLTIVLVIGTIILIILELLGRLGIE